MKHLLRFLIIVLLILCCAGGYLGWSYIRDHSENKEFVSAEELLGVSGEDIAVYYDFLREEAGGIFRDGTVYLPLSWVNERLNDKFYWDRSENLLIYTLPDDMLYADMNASGANGAPLIITKKGQVYISAGLVTGYTDIAALPYTADGNKRIYITPGGAGYDTAVLNKDTVLREGQSIKSRGITELHEGDTVRVVDAALPTADKAFQSWAMVLSEDGWLGFLPESRLSDRSTVTQISTYDEPVYTHISLDEPIVLVWHLVSNKDVNKYLEPNLDKTSGVNVVSPTWFALEGSGGELSSLADGSYVEAAHARGLQVWALVDNFSNEGVSTSEFLESRKARPKAIEALVKAAREYGFDGINVDFELVPNKSAADYVQFVRELSVSCRKEGLVLSVDVPNPASYNLYYGRKMLAEAADYVINMGYDEHYAGSEMGSVSSYPWFAEGIKDSLEEVPADRLIGGIPFYTRVWKEDGSGTTSTALGLGEAAKWVEENDVALTWDVETGQYYGQKGNAYIWLEDNESLKLKMQAIKDAKLAGTAGWRLGLQNEEVWEVVRY